MTLDLVSESRCFGGRQLTYRHASKACACEMRFACFLPPAAESRPVPAVYWLSGLTCTEENFSVKSGAQRYAAELGIALIIPDTSPRGVNLPGENDFVNVGTGAGFYMGILLKWNKPTAPGRPVPRHNAARRTTAARSWPSISTAP